LRHGVRGTDELGDVRLKTKRIDEFLNVVYMYLIPLVVVLGVVVGVVVDTVTKQANTHRFKYVL